ncbi:serine O-acetyltransferase [Candidatus Nitronereus thalassa]|uniref:Serine acetyltransferase n=1 Tax=Candidatus Nitronereus thalassa TaxID=3020898 RepID=A0ABU3K6K5_9BACT|nr:serine O-acetyltransferase [Candidatus Nitronereus thalassa]MDT7041983.1 serine O-acetyltransferase [Candidatus Nitronereus thalassa]
MAFSHDSDCQKEKALGFWSTVQGDICRLREEDGSLWTLTRGLLSQGFIALFGYRVFRWFFEQGIPTQPFRFVVERLIEITTGISIPAQACIGKGMRIHHFGGIMIHPDAVIGEDCTMYQGVTIGDRWGRGGVPSIGNRVYMGAGAKLIGPIEIGDDCQIGANAVVLASVPPGCVAVGVPAVVKIRKTITQLDAV